MKSDIRAYLKPGEFVSGSFLAKKLGISRNAINKKVKNLVSQGFVIESRRNQGYCLKKIPDILDISRLPSRLKNTSVGDRIIYKRECPSTQLIAKKYAGQSSEEFLIIAEQQSAGYGRIQRKWISPPGGLWFSLLLRPDILPDESSQLTFLMAIVISRILREENIPAGIKWPNDVLVNNKKVCGILTEMAAEMDKVYWVIVGVGLNVNNQIPADIGDIAISLRQILGKTVDRTDLLIKILQRFFEFYRIFLDSGFQKFSPEYEKFLLFRNKVVRVKQFTGITSGKLIGINDKGHLIINTGEKKVEVLAGDLIKEG